MDKKPMSEGVSAAGASQEAAELALLTCYRRDLHRIPELEFELPQTLSYIGEKLRPLEADPRITVFSPTRSALCCFFDVGKEKTCAVRTDMDALPVCEETGVAFASEHAGCMHACGHDGHMAMALALAQHVAAHMAEMVRNVLIVFQPAEETTGGARFICESGVFQAHQVDCIFGFHLWPDLPQGQIASRPGALLAASNETNLTVRGVSTHIAKAEQGKDALLASAQTLLNLYAYLDTCATSEPCVLRFGHELAGSVRNQIADVARLEGSLRTFSVEMGTHLMHELPRLAEESAQRFGCSATMEFSEGYPPVVNDEALYARAKRTLPELTELAHPLLIAEDFAFYQRTLPGVFLLLGTGTGIPLHSNAFTFDEKILLTGLQAYKRLIRMP
ncbi:MAG: M20 metallopeptidase family protein [Atopobiaceae bacterium]|jgi:amidohydrolase